jgi:hypothetical protein
VFIRCDIVRSVAPRVRGNAGCVKKKIAALARCRDATIIGNELPANDGGLRHIRRAAGNPA